MNYTLKELLDIPKLRILLDSMEEILRMPSAIIDIEGNVLSSTGWQDICTKFHRINKDTARMCVESDKSIGSKLVDKSPFVTYRCPMGLVDSAVPIIVEGQHIGNIFAGQLFLEEPDESDFVNQAQRFGFDEDEYLAAMRKVPRFHAEQLEKTLTIIKNLTELLTQQGLQLIRLRRAEQIQQETEEMFRIAFDNAPSGMSILDSNGRTYLAVNPLLCEMFGYTKDELLGKAIQLVTHPDDIARTNEWVRKKMNNEPCESDFEKRYIHKDGHVVWGLVRSHWIKDNNGNNRMCIAHILDITSRKNAEAALIKSERILNATECLAKVGGWEWDLMTQTLHWTDETYRIHEMDRHESKSVSAMQVKQSLRCYAPDDRVTVIKAFRRCQQQGEPYDLELPFTTTKGRHLWIRTTAEAVRKNGHVIRIIGNILDITERRKVEEQRRKSHELLSKLARLVPGVIYQARLYPDGRSSFPYASPGITDLYELTPEEVQQDATPLYSRLHPDDFDRLCQGIKQSARTLQSFDCEYRVILPKRGLRWLWTQAIPERMDEGSTLWHGVIVDITERKSAESAISHSHDLMRYIIEHANSSVAVLDKELKFTYVSQRFIDDFTPQNREIIGKHHYDVFPDLPQEFRDVHSKALAGEVLSADRTIYPRRDGTVDWGRWECRPWYEDNDSVGGIILYTEFITERVEAEEKLRQSEDYLRSTIAALPLGIISIDLAGTVKSWNVAAEQIFGWSEAEVIGKSLFSAQEGEHTEASALRRQVAEGKNFINIEFTRSRKDGSPVDISLTTAPIRDSQGQVKAFLAIVDEITERKKAKEELRKSEERLKFALQMNHTAGWELDTTTQVFSRTLEHDRIFGYESPLAIWTVTIFLDHVVAEDRANVSRQFHSAIASETDLNFECRIICQGGEIRWIWVAGYHLPGLSGSERRIAGILQDISDRKKAEEEKSRLNAQLIQAQKMESVGRLAGGVAHDYNNMLSVILGYTEIALGSLDPKDSLRFELGEILKAANRSANITRQLLAFSRQQPIVPRRIDLNETVESMINMLRRLIGENINLSWHPGKKLWPVFMDPTQLDQILVNLCVNARDAISAMGNIAIETGTKTFDTLYCRDHCGFIPGEFVMLTINDDGCGMDKATRENIFEPFFTTKEIGQGTGLGLATVYGIVKQNNSFINIYSEPNQGTTFNIYFPRHETEENFSITRNENDIIPTITNGNETILLVEDDQTILKMTSRILTYLGYNVLSTNSPDKASIMFQEYPGKIELLITDVVMPGMNGNELFEKLKTFSPGLKILFMSGYTANIIAHRGVLNDGANFIQKPFTQTDLSAKVQEVLTKAPDSFSKNSG